MCWTSVIEIASQVLIKVKWWQYTRLVLQIFLIDARLGSKLWNEPSLHQHASCVVLKVSLQTASLWFVWLTSSPLLTRRYVCHVSIRDLNLIISNLLDLVCITEPPLDTLEGNASSSLGKDFMNPSDFIKVPLYLNLLLLWLTIQISQQGVNVASGYACKEWGSNMYRVCGRICSEW